MSSGLHCKRIKIVIYDHSQGGVNVINDAFRNINDTSRSLIDDTRMTLQIVVSLMIIACHNNKITVHTIVLDPLN